MIQICCGTLRKNLNQSESPQHIAFNGCITRILFSRGGGGGGCMWTLWINPSFLEMTYPPFPRLGLALYKVNRFISLLVKSRLFPFSFCQISEFIFRYFVSKDFGKLLPSTSKEIAYRLELSCIVIQIGLVF